MKLFIFALMFIGLDTYATTKLTINQQKEIVEKIAKAERRELWVTGHEDVSSAVTYVTSAELAKLLKEDSEDSEQPLNEQEIFDVKQCSKSKKTCSVFTIDVSGSYMGGYGHIRFWILINPMNGKFSKISQSIYTE